MCSVSPHHQLTGDIGKLLAVTPQDRGSFGSVLSCHSEVPSSQKPVFPSHPMHPCDLLTPGFYPVLTFFHYSIISLQVCFSPSRPLSPSIGLCCDPLLLKHLATRGTSGCFL